MNTMTIPGSKWLIAVLALISILAILYFLGRKSVHTEITIEATSNEVWAVLTNTSKIQEWNPVLIPIEGKLREGSKVKYEFRQDDNSTSEILATVKQMIRDKLLNQNGGIPGILTFDHKYILESIEGTTKVIVHEDYRGIGVVFWNPASVEKAYEKLLIALKERVLKLQKDNELDKQ